MDVDNIHWPNFPNFKGSTNNSIDFFNSGIKETKGSPYVGMGRRHAAQHYTSLLSAHVWVSGWHRTISRAIIGDWILQNKRAIFI